MAEATAEEKAEAATVEAAMAEVKEAEVMEAGATVAARVEVETVVEVMVAETVEVARAAVETEAVRGAEEKAAEMEVCPMPHQRSSVHRTSHTTHDIRRSSHCCPSRPRAAHQGCRGHIPPTSTQACHLDHSR